MWRFASLLNKTTIFIFGCLIGLLLMDHIFSSSLFCNRLTQINVITHCSFAFSENLFTLSMFCYDFRRKCRNFDIAKFCSQNHSTLPDFSNFFGLWPSFSCVSANFRRKFFTNLVKQVVPFNSIKVSRVTIHHLKNYIMAMF